MWLKFLYFIWFLVPILSLTFFIIHRVDEKVKNRKTDKIIIRSHYYFQVTFFSAVCTIAALLINHYILIPNVEQYFSTKYTLEMMQLILYPFLIAALSPLAGSNKPPETLQDKIKKHGYLELQRKKEREANRRS